jgi:hypothetical protein
MACGLGGRTETGHKALCPVPADSAQRGQQLLLGRQHLPGGQAEGGNESI